MTNISFSSNMVGLTATTAVLCYSAFGEPIPQDNYTYNSTESVQQYPSQYDYYILTESDSISIADKIEILYKFSKSILDNIKDIDPEYSALVDEKFWDLL